MILISHLQQTYFDNSYQSMSDDVDTSGGSSCSSDMENETNNLIGVSVAFFNTPFLSFLPGFTFGYQLFSSFNLQYVQLLFPIILSTTFKACLG